MKLVINQIKDVRDSLPDDKFIISGVLLAEHGEEQLYAEMVDAQKQLSNSNSAINVIDDKVVFTRASVVRCGNVLTLLTHNFGVTILVEFSPSAMPKDLRPLIKMELGVN